MAGIEHLFIVGAGFSSYAGLPLTGDFTEALLDVEGLKEGPSRSLVAFLQQFVHDTFDHSETAPAKFWPALEDLFTCVDLSANSGHHLGSSYAPAILRTVRRALIVRIIRMLRQKYDAAKKREEGGLKQLRQFFSRIDLRRSAFISMNWDTVIEEGLSERHGALDIEYGCEAQAAEFRKGEVRKSTSRRARGVQALKLHGSVNWVYCDNCRQLFWFPPWQAVTIASQLFTETDQRLVERILDKPFKGKSIQRRCPVCRAPGLGTRLATFSYRKALDFPMFQRCWLSAERLLREARTWVFIGYSLPPADYEFKYLLKHVQLSQVQRPELILITGGDERKAEETYQNYQRFFGRRISKSEHKRSYFSDGLGRSTLGFLREAGILP